MKSSRSIYKFFSPVFVAVVATFAPSSWGQAGAQGTQSGPAPVTPNQSRQAIIDAQTEAACLAQGASMCTGPCKGYPSIQKKGWCPEFMAGASTKPNKPSIDPAFKLIEENAKFDGPTSLAIVPGETAVAKKGDRLPSASTPAAKDPAADPSGKSDPTDGGSDKSGSGSPSGSGGSAQDSGACQQAAQEAFSACGSQGGGGYGSGSGGINSYSSYLSGAAGSAASSNIQQGGACSRAWQSCVNACQSVNPGQANSCQSLANQQSQMGQQALANQGAQQGAGQSGNASSTMPGSSTGANNCDANPSSPECKALADAKKQTAGQSGFNDVPKDVRAKDFNVGDTSDGAKLGYQGSGIGIDQIKAGSRNGTVANNAGGSIPGQGGDSGGARLGGGRGGSPGAPGYTTDILQGYQGGGGGSTAGGSTDTNGSADGGFGGYGSGSQARGPAGEGLDLRKYLPGGRNDPGTRLGGFKPFSLEINGPHYNIWGKVSDRYIEKCKLGELIDCR